MWVCDFELVMSKHFDTPDEFIQAMGYFSAGAAMAGRVYVAAPKRTWTNLYVILCSPPGWYHKSSMVSTTMELLRGVLSEDEILPSNPSVEAMGRKISSLSDRGIRHGVLVYDEFRSFLSHVRKEYAAPVASLVTEKLEPGVPVVFSKTKESGTEDFRIPGDFVFSFVASTTTPWLLENIRSSDISGGMMSRFIIVEAHKQTRIYELPDPIDRSVLSSMASDLESIRKSYSKETVFTFSSDAKKLYSSIYRSLKQDAESMRNPEYPSLVSRGPLYIKKLSLINAVLSGRSKTVIEGEDVEMAAEFVWKGVKSCRRISDESAAMDGTYGKSLVRIRKVLEGAGMVYWNDLLRIVPIRPKEIEEVVESLIEQRLADRFMHDGNVVIAWKGSGEEW